MAAARKAARFPAEVGACVDMLYVDRAERLQLERDVEAMKAREAELKAHIMGLLSKQKLDGAKGRVATAAVKYTRTFRVDDWKKFWDWARQDRLGVYVHKRCAVEALREWTEEHKKAVPGVDAVDVADLSLTKV